MQVGARVERIHGGNRGVVAAISQIEQSAFVQWDDDEREWVGLQTINEIAWELGNEEMSQMELCQYGLNCPREAVTVLRIPVLGAVDSCRECADGYLKNGLGGEGHATGNSGSN